MDQVKVCATIELSADVNLPERPQSTLLQIELDRALAALPVRTIALVQIKGVYHSSDFMSVNWYGTEFVFTTNQALCIKALWTSLEKEASSMTSKAILRKVGIKQVTLERVFHNTFNGIRRRHPALGVMIVPDKGEAIRYRLNVREYTCRSQDVLASRTSGDTVGKF